MSNPQAATVTAVGTAPASPWRKRAERDVERQAERELKREAVLRTAAQVFNERGFQASTLDEVAARLNVSKPTLYYYVKSKDDILFECVHAGLVLLQRAVEDVRASGGNGFERLQAAMHQYAEIATADFGMCIIRVGEDPLPSESRRELRRIKAGLDHEFRLLVQQCIDEGSIAPCDPKLAAFTILGALSWIARWYRPDGTLNPPQIADQCIDMLMRGMLPRPTTAALSPSVSPSASPSASLSPSSPQRTRRTRS